MGQYYRGVVLGKTTKKSKKIIVKQAYCCYAHDNGAKLMEHSYVGNSYVKAYENALANEFYGYPFVWAGDYGDGLFDKLPYDEACDFIDKKIESRAKKQKYYKVEYNNYEKLLKNGEIVKKAEEDFVEKIKSTETYKYIINFDKKVAVKIPDESRTNLIIHPLPLLCADGNGRGGGDYHGSNMELVGSWAYDRIGIDNELPKDITLEKITFKEY